MNYYDRKDRYKYTGGLSNFEVSHGSSVADQSRALSDHLTIMVCDPTRSVSIEPSFVERNDVYKERAPVEMFRDIHDIKKTPWYISVCTRGMKTIKDKLDEL